jgi:UDP-N-acetylmuramoylalanine--D-glutamate ligase
LISQSELGLSGSHNISNALAALALGTAVNLSLKPMLKVLRKFKGLPHRYQTVRILNNVTYINDSKATNLGATLAAIGSLPANGNIILVLGGQPKGQNFSILAPSLSGLVKSILLIGEAASEIDTAISGIIDTFYAVNVEDAVLLSNKLSSSGDVVLFSPGCASLDMFASFEERGEKFTSAVEDLK